MEAKNGTLESQADLLAAQALHELGSVPLDEPDEYAEQCNYAGCYPWLAEVIHAHPHDSVTRYVGRNVDTAVEDTDFFC